MYYKENINGLKEGICTIPKSRLSFLNSTKFKIVVEEENGQKGMAEIDIDKLNPTPIVTHTTMPTQTSVPTSTPISTPTLAPTIAPTNTSTTVPSISPKPTPTLGPTPVPTNTPVPTTTATSTPSATPTTSASPSTTPTATPIPTASPSPTPTPTSDKLTAEEAGQVIANCAIDMFKNHRNEFAYGAPSNEPAGKARRQAYKGKKTSGYLYGTSNWYPGKQNVYFKNRYQMDCEGFVNCMVHWSLGIGGSEYTKFSAGKYGFTYISKEKLGMSKKINKDLAKQMLKPGDIIWLVGHYALYVGNGQIVEIVNKSKPSLDNWTLYMRDVTVWNGHHDFRGVYRISEATAASVDTKSYKMLYPKYLKEMMQSKGY